MNDNDRHEFYKWLDDCPVGFSLVDDLDVTDSGSITYQFEMADDNDDGDFLYDQYKEDRAGIHD